MHGPWRRRKSRGRVSLLLGQGRLAAAVPPWPPPACAAPLAACPLPRSTRWPCAAAPAACTTTRQHGWWVASCASTALHATAGTGAPHLPLAWGGMSEAGTKVPAARTTPGPFAGGLGEEPTPCAACVALAAVPGGPWGSRLAPVTSPSPRFRPWGSLRARGTHSTTTLGGPRAAQELLGLLCTEHAPCSCCVVAVHVEVRRWKHKGGCGQLLHGPCRFCRCWCWCWCWCGALRSWCWRLCSSFLRVRSSSSVLLSVALLASRVALQQVHRGQWVSLLTAREGRAGCKP